jgi:hypothetical protein
VRRRFLLASVAALCGIGLLVILLGHWFVLEPNSQPGEQRNLPPVEVRMLQPLITGNLAVFLAWVWLDLRAPRRNEADGDAGFGLWLMATAVAVVSTFSGAAWAGTLEQEPFVPFLLFLVSPVLVVTIPLLWLTARKMERAWQRAVLLPSVVVTSGLVQHGYKTGPDAELQIFTINSCLIGLAVAVWLVAWAVSPEPRRTA